LILAIETSCDDTCAAVTEGGRIRSNVISSQAAAHARFGGVVPEVASRHHLELVNPVIDAALAEAEVELTDLDSLAVTRGPGLIGALLVGVATAKAIAAATRKPLAGVNHLHGHVAANFLEPDPLEPRFEGTTASRSEGGPWTMPPGRPWTRAPACWSSAIRADRRSSGWRSRAIPSRSPFRSE
jgi:tRNA N6-adenosine threonylcarbamoyltransferase